MESLPFGIPSLSLPADIDEKSDSVHDHEYEHGEIVLISSSDESFHGSLARVNHFIPVSKSYELDVCDEEGEEHTIVCKAANVSMVYPINHYAQAILDNGQRVRLKQCVSCGEQNVVNKLSGCPFCRSVFYCSPQIRPECTMANLMMHKMHCDFYQKFAVIEYPLIKQHSELFKFNTLMVAFDDQSRNVEHYWLKQMNLLDKGIWKRFCDCCTEPFGELDQATLFENLDASFVPKFDESQILKSNAAVKGWKEYYEQKRLPLESPMAHWMSYIMTVYHMLTRFMKIKPKVMEKISQNAADQDFVIYLVGVEKELDMLPLFKELLCLLPGWNFTVYCFGNNEKVSDSLHSKTIRYHIKDDSNFIEFKVFKCDFEEDSVGKFVNIKAHQRPNVVIGLNAGISAYGDGWTKALHWIQKYGIPFICTEYFNHSILVNETNLTMQFGMQLTERYVPNPFRSPIVKFMDQTRFATFANGFMFAVNTN